MKERNDNMNKQIDLDKTAEIPKIKKNDLKNNNFDAISQNDLYTTNNSNMNINNLSKKELEILKRNIIQTTLNILETEALNKMVINNVNKNSR